MLPYLFFVYHVKDNNKSQQKIKIKTPKMLGPNKECLDLSDHYPMEFQPNQDIKIVSYNLQYLYTIIADKSGSEAFGKRTTEQICQSAKEFAKYFSRNAQADICCVQDYLIVKPTMQWKKQ